MKYSLSAIIAAVGQLHAGLISLAEHVDIRWKWSSAGGWTCEAVTDSNGEIAYGAHEVFLPLSDKPNVSGNPANSGARFTQPVSAAFAFTGVPAGQPLWVAVQGTPGIGEAWPGMENNQDAGTFGSYIPGDPRVSQTTARPWIKISLDGYTPPPGTAASFSLWNTSTGTPPKVWMSTYDSGTVNEYYYAEGTHNHMNWGFSAVGIHRVRLKASAFAGPGESNPTGFSAVHTLTFAIGPLAQWQASYFSGPELDDPAISGPDADPDFDGMKNFVEFAFGLNPVNGSTLPETAGLGLPKLSVVEENGEFYHVLEYPARRAGSQVAPLLYFPQFSSDLDWQTDGITTNTGDFPVEMDSLNAVWEKVVSRRSVGPIAPARGFGRVQVSSGD
jgi:surface-anchored protein